MATYYALNRKATRAQAPLLEPGDEMLVEPGQGLAEIALESLQERGIKSQAEAVNDFHRWLEQNRDTDADAKITKFEELVCPSVHVGPVR